MTQQVKALVAEPGDLTSILGTAGWKENRRL